MFLVLGELKSVFHNRLYFFSQKKIQDKRKSIRIPIKYRNQVVNKLP